MNNYFETSDINFAAAICLFYPLDDLNKQNPTKVMFIFKREFGLDDLIQKYWGNELLVNPIAYASQLRYLKGR
jgi:hypothetical protein